MDTNVLIGILVSFVIIVVIFFLLREVMCWYWKINRNLKIQEEQLQLQKDSILLLQQLVKLEKDESYARTSVLKTHSDYTPKTAILTEGEMNEINSRIPDLNENEIIVFNTVSRIIKKIHKTEFKEDGNWIIVKEYIK